MPCPHYPSLEIRTRHASSLRVITLLCTHQITSLRKHLRFNEFAVSPPRIRGGAGGGVGFLPHVAAIVENPGGVAADVTARRLRFELMELIGVRRIRRVFDRFCPAILH